MSRLRVVRRGTLAEMTELRQAMRLPRTDIVAERAAGRDRYEAESGPFSSYERRLSLRPAAGPEPEAERDEAARPPTDAGAERGGRPDREGAPESSGSWELTEETTYRLAVPVWRWLFHGPVRRALRRRQDSFGYWWAPPDRFSPRHAAVLGLLCTAQVVDGYLGTVLTQTLTYAADEFGHGNTAQGVVLAMVRAGVLLALAAVALSDRFGRRRLLVAAGIASCAATAMGALSPALWFLGGTQFLARGLSTALGLLIAIVAVEETPARSRAWAASVLVLCAGLGAGMAVMVLSVADAHVKGWRVVYLVPLAGIAVLVWVGRRLPESRRFEAAAEKSAAAETTAPKAGADTSAKANADNTAPNDVTSDDNSKAAHDETSADNAAAHVETSDDNKADDAADRTGGYPRAGGTDEATRQRRRRRIVLLAGAAFLLAMFAAPASSLQNDFLKDERGFSAAAISLFTLTTSTPVGIGVLVGGYLADRRGRRPVGATGILLGTSATALAYFTAGPALWLLTLGGSVFGGLAVPALVVYGPELFGTVSRGRANGVIASIGVTGSAAGLLATGWLSDALGGRLGPALALMAVGPLAVAVLVVTKFPETAGRVLEDLNPEDRS